MTVKKEKVRPEEKGEFHITVPKPFRFFNRDRRPKKTIRQQKLEQMLADKKAEEDKLIQHRFKANPIPQSTTMPRYEKMKAAKEARTAEVKKASYEITKAREKPFAFYERDKDFYVKRAKAAEENIPEVMRNIKPFKAAPIPAAVSSQMLGEMQQRENQIREERTKKRAQELIELAKLPPRMEMHEQEKRQGGGKQKKLTPSDLQFSFEPPRARPVPDYKKQQQVFQKTLEKHKMQRQSTQPQPFNFMETKVFCIE